jgi:hypothetical protein
LIEAPGSSEASDGTLKLEFEIELHTSRGLSGHRPSIKGRAYHPNVCDIIFVIQNVGKYLYAERLLAKVGRQGAMRRGIAHPKRSDFSQKNYGETSCAAPGQRPQ